MREFWDGIAQWFGYDYWAWGSAADWFVGLATVTASIVALNLALQAKSNERRSTVSGVMASVQEIAVPEDEYRSFAINVSNAGVYVVSQVKGHWTWLTREGERLQSVSAVNGMVPVKPQSENRIQGDMETPFARSVRYIVEVTDVRGQVWYYDLRKGRYISRLRYRMVMRGRKIKKKETTNPPASK
ncbi:hypothetical protein [Plantibacter sp. T3]|uniref:hypothetical protein n=1 Tax=Plantibacter sp. T3 TaxID=2653161 RepID=UPI0012EFBB1C|nr:hypothetical protein [Plantibacter sp. T3]VXC39239.1 hypothetical protein PLANTIT3_80099 [Plantibacter sp. T3]